VSYPIPLDEVERLAALRRYEVLDTPPEAIFDHVTKTLSRTLDIPVTLISLIDSSRQWFKSTCGLDISETPREVAFCAHTIMGEGVMVVPDATKDRRFASNPLVVGPPHIRFYAGMPIRTRDGLNVGTLCAIDMKPRELTPAQADTLSELGMLVADLFELRLQAKRVVDIEQAARIDTETRMLEKSRALIESDERFREVASQIPGVVYQFKIDPEGKWSFPYVSPTIRSALGLDPQAVMNDPEVWFNAVVPEDRSLLKASIFETYRTLEPWRWEGRALNAAGEVSWFRGSSVPKRQPDGSVLWNGFVLDQTDLRKTQEQLRQAQKMEAVGQLTGGVAHDFNNLLAVIHGNAELLSDDIGGGNDSLRAIQRAVMRGSELTQQLLAFSRRQSLRPQAIDLSRLVSDLARLLGRSLGETIGIQYDIERNCWPAHADPGQLENAIVNIAINARDAMPEGGLLRISCANVNLGNADIEDLGIDKETDPVNAGGYVRIAVSDTGTGMAPEVAAHAFEPFFTTKEVGKGSGLGLSMVYGFARQSGGFARIDSPPGLGATIEIYLPRSERAGTVSHESVIGEVPKGEGEKILVIEDDGDLRSLVVKLLSTLDYRVFEAADANEAAAVMMTNADISLVLSDVVLPGGVSGPAFIANMRPVYPDFAVVYMSGYPQSRAGTGGLGEIDENKLLVKPFNTSKLAHALRDALVSHRRDK
jgi:signal transduction histidine kinase/ActR/RegA family two-component response regulator